MKAAVRRRGTDERGATLVLLSLTLVALLGVAGLVVDFGLVRTDRQQNKSAADLAVAAGMRGLEFGARPAPFRGVCEAVKYLKANQAELASMTGTFLGGDGTSIASSDPCTPSAPEWNQVCVANTPSTWAWYRGGADGGRLRVDVKTGYALSDSVGGDPFPDEAMITGDDGDPDLGNCDHLAVIISETQSPGLGKVVYLGDLTSRVRSVGRVAIGTRATTAIGLLLLDPTACQSLHIQGGNARAVAKGFGDEPGYIHADSNGTTNCSGTKVLDNSAPSPYGIYAEQSQTPAGGETPGSISVTALLGPPGNVNAYSPETDAVVRQGTTAPPYGAQAKGRTTVDERYLAHISALETAAEDRFSLDATTAAAAGYAVYDTCSLPNPVPAATKIFVNCPALGVSSDLTFNGPVGELVFSGRIAKEGGGALDFRNVRRLFVEGSASDDYAIVVKGNSTSSLRVNQDGFAKCADRQSANRNATTAFVIGHGGMATEGQASVGLCSTTLYLADGTLPATVGVDPYPNSFTGYLAVSGQGTIDWTAPNQRDDMGCNVADPSTPTCYDPATYPFEDLALWTEAAGTVALSNTNCGPSEPRHCLQGNGILDMTGVFFVPNGNAVRIAGNGFQDIGHDAQFITRKLQVGGEAIVSVRPNPVNAVLVPIFEGFIMVR